MSPLEAYLFLLADSFVAGLVLPAKQAIVFPAMTIFGGYNLYLAGLISTIGITAAASLNWVFGKMLRSLKKNGSAQKQSEVFRKILERLKKYGYLAALLGFIPILGSFITVFTGIVATSFVRVISIVFLVNLIAHSLTIYLS